jgi:hypothetical protein
MRLARQIYMGLAWLFVALVVLQVFLAGAGIFGNFGSDLDPHRGLGSLMQLVSIILLLLALVGRMGKTIIWVTVALVATMILQSVWVHVDSRWVKAIHPMMSIMIFAAAHMLAQRATQLLKGEAAPAG